MFVPSIVYAVAHAVAAPAPKTGDYAVHFTGAMLRTLGQYWTWSTGPVYLWTPVDAPKWVVGLGAAVVSLGLAAFLVRKRGPSLFCLVWFLVTIAPVLPLRDHTTEYYVFLPLIGLCWLGGWAAVEAWHAGTPARTAAIALAAIYVLMVLPQAVLGSRWNYDISIRVRNLVEGVAGAHERHPREAILLEGVDTDLFWNGVLDRPYRLLGLDHVYLAPGSERDIEAHPDLGDIGEYVLPAEVALRGIERGELVVYDVRGPRLRNITAEWTARPRESAPPLRVDAGSPLTAYLLGPEWYGVDADHRWMPRRATLRMGAPAEAGRKLYLRGACPEDMLRQGPVTVTVTIDGTPLPTASIGPGAEFELAFSLPASVAGRREMQVAIESSRSFVPPSDPRELALAFGVIEVR
jgi:hypothetical protein